MGRMTGSYVVLLFDTVTKTEKNHRKECDKTRI